MNTFLLNKFLSIKSQVEVIWFYLKNLILSEKSIKYWNDKLTIIIIYAKDNNHVILCQTQNDFQHISLHVAMK